jgi:hypothetical protein
MSDDNTVCLRCDLDGHGAVYAHPDTPLWRCSALPAVSRGMSPSLQIDDGEQGSSYAVHCEQRYPHTRYAIFDGSSRKGRIRRHGLFRNHYDVDLGDGGHWQVHLPMFSIHLSGVSTAGDVFRGRIVRFDTWYVDLPAAIRSPALLAALLAIQRERHTA